MFLSTPLRTYHIARRLHGMFVPILRPACERQEVRKRDGISNSRLPAWMAVGETSLLDRRTVLRVGHIAQHAPGRGHRSLLWSLTTWAWTSMPNPAPFPLESADACLRCDLLSSSPALIQFSKVHSMLYVSELARRLWRLLIGKRGFNSRR